MAKKKKTQLKPVARGFATVSVAKKVVPAEPETPDSAEDVQNRVDAQTTDNIGEGSSAEAQKASDDVHQDSRTAELQALVDKFQDRTEKEIVRTLKALEQEKRFSATLPRIEYESTYLENALQLLRERSPMEALPPSHFAESEEKALPQLAITYGVLRRLGFPEDIVENCLRSIPGIDLDQALEWIFIHHSDEELGFSKEHVSPEKSTATTTPQGSNTPTTLLSPTSSHARLGSVSKGALDPNARPFSPSSAWSIADTPGAASPALFSGSGPASPPITDDDPTSSYVQVKMRIADLTTHRKPGETADASFLRSLQKRLEDIKGDYFFDGREAEEAYRVERRKADEEALQSRLRGESANKPIVPKSPPPKASPNPPAPNPSIEPTRSTDIFDDENSDDEPGGLFGALQELPETITTDTGSTIHVRDMTLPKNWSGRTPRTLLLETVHKTDKTANVSFRLVSGSSRAKRAAARIIWSRGDVDEWEMTDVACPDQAQAEQYVAMVALHAMAFPIIQGFAIGGTAVASSQTSYRVLPPVFRNLWTELEEKRRDNDDQINRTIWGKLKDILAPKLAQLQMQGKRNKATAPPPKRLTGEEQEYQQATSVDLMAAFQARQASPAYHEMLQQRNTLPIAAYRDTIIRSLEESQVLVLSGETGCGKSTQLPAFILEDYLSRGEHCKIYCTEPRRISAISLATRVSRELGEPAGAVGNNGSLVGYSIRLESNTSKTTRLAYVTNGIALRMLEGGASDERGSSFDEITHIIIDEVHERTIESDFLLIVLKSLIKQRPQLKVVLMSATLDADKISNYFDGCPVLQVPGRTFPVEVQYLEDAIEFTKWKVVEGSPYAIRGYDKYSKGKARADWSEDLALGEDEEDDIPHQDVKLGKRYAPSTASTINLLDERLVPYELIMLLLEGICLRNSPYASYSSAVLVFMPGMGEIRRLHDMLMEHPVFSSEGEFRIYPLHSTIASDQQAAVFDIPPVGVRKIVIATNIAETGITIPDITCVIDTGRQREMRYDEKRQLSRLVETFVARSNAAQRRGRAGRVQPGLCFHLFTKQRHDTKMQEHPDPEMMRLSLSDLALRIKIMKVKLGDSIEDVLSRALDPPSSINVQRAVSSLVEVKALTSTEEITPLGRLLSKLPTDVHLGKFLLIACVFKCLDPALTIAATLNSKSPFLTPFGKEDEAHRKKLSFRIENSDFLTLHNVFASWRRACNNGGSAARKLCRDYFLSHQNLQQIEELRQQFLGYLIDSSFIRVDRSVIQELNRARYSSRGRTRFVTPPAELDINASNFPIINAALTAGLYPKILSAEVSKFGSDKLVTVTNNQAVSFHPSSVNFGRKPRDFGVSYLCYFTIMQSKKMYAWETGPVDDLSLLLLCGDAEFKILSNSVFVDKKIRYRIDPRAGIALKFLRNHLASILASHFRKDRLAGQDPVWEEIAMAMLGKVKPQDNEKKLESITLVVNRVLASTG